MPPENERLAAGAAALGLEVDAEQLSVLLGYLQRLEKWNRVYNLTAIREHSQMLTHHLLDSMSVVGPLRHRLPGSASVLDVGSGAGFPGAVIAVLMRNVEVTCVDSVAKKTAFVHQAAAELAITRLHAMHTRVERLRLSVAPDVIVSRAYAALHQFVSTTRHLMHEQGCWLAMWGAYTSAEALELPAEVEVFHVEQVTVPELAAVRHLVWMRMRR